MTQYDCNLGNGDRFGVQGMNGIQGMNGVQGMPGTQGLSEAEMKEIKRKQLLKERKLKIEQINEKNTRSI